MDQPKQPETQSMQVSEARAQFSALLNRVYRGETRVLVEKHGIPVAALVSPRDLAALQRLEEQEQADRAILEASRAAFQDIPDEELEAEISKAIATVRAERRAEQALIAKTS